MPSFSESFGRWRRERQNQFPMLGVGIFVLAASIWVGFQARSVAASLAKKDAAWQQTAEPTCHPSAAIPRSKLL